MLVAGDKIQRVEELAPILDQVKRTGRPLLVFCTDIQKDPLSALVYNKTKGLVKTCAVNVPWQAGEEVEMLRDIAVLTGAQFVDNRTMRAVKNVTLDSLGSCKYAKISANETQLIGTRGNKEAIARRVADLKASVASDKSVSPTRRNITKVSSPFAHSRLSRSE